MALTVHSLLLIAALICFFVGAIGVATGRVGIVSLGLFFLTAAFLLP